MKQEFGYGVSNVQAQEVSAYQAEVVRRESGQTARGLSQVSAGLGQLSQAAQREQKELSKNDDKQLNALAEAYHALKDEGITGSAAELKLSETGMTSDRIKRKLARAGGIDNLREPAFRYRLSELDGQTAWYQAKSSLDLIDDEVVKLLAGMGLTEEDANGNVIPVNVEDYEARAAAMYEAALSDIEGDLEKDPLSLATFKKNSIPDVAARVTAAKKQARRVREVDYARQTGESLLNGLDMFFSGKDTWGHPVDGDVIGNIFESIWKANYPNVAEQDKGALASSFVASVGAEVGRRVAEGTINPYTADGSEDLEELFDAIEASLPPDMEADHREVFDQLEKLRAEFATTELERVGHEVGAYDTRMRFRNMGLKPTERLPVEYSREAVLSSLTDREDPDEIKASVKEMETLWKSGKDSPEKRAEMAEFLSTEFHQVDPADAPKVFLALMEELRETGYRAEERQYVLDTRDKSEQDRQETKDRRQKDAADKESADTLTQVVNALQADSVRTGKVSTSTLNRLQPLVDSLNDTDRSKYGLVLTQVTENPELPKSIRNLVASGRDTFRSVFAEQNQTAGEGNQSVPTYSAQQLARVDELYAQAEEQVLNESIGDPNLASRIREEPERVKGELLASINDRAKSLMAQDVTNRQANATLSAEQSFDAIPLAGRSLPDVGRITKENFLAVVPEVLHRSGLYAGDPQGAQMLTQTMANSLEYLNRPEIARGDFASGIARTISNPKEVLGNGKRRDHKAPLAFEKAVKPLVEQFQSADQAESDAAAFALNYLLISNGMIGMGDDGTQFRDYMTAASEALDAKADALPRTASKATVDYYRKRAEVYADLALVPFDVTAPTFEKALLYKAPEFAPGGKFYGIYLDGKDDLNFDWQAGDENYQTAVEAATEQLRMMLDVDFVSPSMVYQWMVSQSQIQP